MRISDWSSDVCASDLGVPTTICAPPRNERRSFDASIPPTHVALRAPALPYNQASSRLTCNASSRVGAITSARGRAEERVQEKSVSVRVDRGGRRIIKTQQPQHILHISHTQHNN